MKLRAIALCAVLASASLAGAQFVGPGGVVPVVANLGGGNDTSWRTDVTVLNLSDSATTITMVLMPEIVEGSATFEQVVSDPISIPAGGQIVMNNILFSRFGLVGVKGGLSIFSNDGSALVISSRTYNLLDSGGTYGQDVSGVLVSGTAWVAGLEHDAFYRTNIGILVPVPLLPGETLSFEIEIHNGSGAEVGSGTLRFDQAGLQQVSLASFGVGLLLDGYAVITCSDPAVGWYGYASRADQITGDAVFRIARGSVVGAR